MQRTVSENDERIKNSFNQNSKTNQTFYLKYLLNPITWY